MASKMLAAYDSNNRRITIPMAENGEFEKPIRCEFCDATVGFVNGFSREVGDKIVFVSPFFRLKKDKKHHDNCPYNVKSQLKIIARESNSDVIAALDNDRFELRLLAVKKGIEELRDLHNRKQKTVSTPSLAITEKQYISTNKKLGAYINSAQRVLKVRTYCENNAEIEDVLKLVFDGVRLPWRDFYYEDQDYFRCFTNVQRATVHVPMAIRGIVKTNKIINGRKSKFAVINLVGPYRQTDEEQVMDAANFSIWSPNIDSFKPYQEDDEILAFGLWTSPKVRDVPYNKPNSNVRLFRNHDLYLWPVDRNQLCKIND